MKTVFLDGASNTPVCTVAKKAMKKYLRSNPQGNSQSIHSYGIVASEAVEQARKSIAADLQVAPGEVFFTSGATEGNNWVIKMTVLPKLLAGEKPHIICAALEHHSVLNCCKQMEELGAEVTYVYPKDIQKRYYSYDFHPYYKPNTCLICIMAVNNELGTENTVNQITAEAESKHIPSLVDCTQALSYGGVTEAIGLRYPSASFMTFSGHKIYAPTGVGCLIQRTGFHLPPLIIGGAQEHGLRGGTTNVVSIVGMAAALHDMCGHDYIPHYIELYQYLMGSLAQYCPKATLNLRPDHFNIISLNCADFIQADQLASMLAAAGIAVSAGSACDSEHDETQGEFHGSHVLSALSLTETEIRNTIRVSFTRYTTKADIRELIKALQDIQQFFKIEERKVEENG